MRKTKSTLLHTKTGNKTHTVKRIMRTVVVTYCGLYLNKSDVHMFRPFGHKMKIDFCKNCQTMRYH